MGRLPVVVSVTRSMKLLMRICGAETLSVRQYKRLFELDNVTLEFSEDALQEAAQEAIRLRWVPAGCAVLSRKLC